MNISLKNGLIVAFSTILLIMVALNTINIIRGDISNSKVMSVDEKTLPRTLVFFELQKDIIEIQQWLTDVSATRAYPGYDDGLSEAYDYYNQALKIIEDLLETYKDSPEDLEKIRLLKTEITDFYNIGKEMAQTYINYGPEGGNPMMEKFDPYAEAINKTITELVDEHVMELKECMLHIRSIQDTTRLISVIASTIALLWSIGLVIAIIKRLNTGVMKVTGYSEDLAKGVLNNRTEYKIRDEFGRLINDFNKSFDALSSLIGNIATLTEKDFELNNHLSAATEEVSSSMVEMDANMNQMSRQMEMHDDVVTETVTAVNQITASINSLTNQIDNQSSAVTQSSASVEEMAASINNVARLSQERNEQTGELLNQLKNTGENLNSTDGIIRRIAELSLNMQNITEVINGIASQTNLLAMNAAIEAAHAGDAGRGFAVVASEIRKLAEETGNNAHLINDTLNQITEIAQTARDSSDENKESFDMVENTIKGFTDTFSEINSSMNELSTGTSEITSAVTSLSDITAQIQSASEEINTGTGEVNNSMSSLQELSHSVLGAIKEVTIGIKEINQAMFELREISSESRSSTETVQQEIQRFTI